MTSEKFSIIKRIKSFSHAFRGLVVLLKEQHNARIHLVAAIIVTFMGYFFSINAAEWITVVIAIALVISAELINSSVEYLCDVVTKDHHPGIRDAKDMAAAAVLIVSIGAAVAGGIIFIPYILNYLNDV